MITLLQRFASAQPSDKAHADTAEHNGTRGGNCFDPQRRLPEAHYEFRSLDGMELRETIRQHRELGRIKIIRPRYSIPVLDDPGCYWTSGFTEDTVFGVLGLIAADNADPKLDFAINILAGRTALMRWVPSYGYVREHIWGGGTLRYIYGGEVLQTAIPEP